MAHEQGPFEGHESGEPWREDDHSRLEPEQGVPAADESGEETELNEQGTGDEPAVPTEEISDRDGSAAGSITGRVDSRQLVRQWLAGTPGAARDVFSYVKRKTQDAVAASRARDDETGALDGDAGADEPVDLTELRTDDELLDALGGTDPDVLGFNEHQRDLEGLLVAWRQDIDAEPVGELVDTDTAVRVIAERRHNQRGAPKRRHLVPVATAAAVLMISFTGVGVAARDALPGDALWGVAQVLYADHTTSVRAAYQAKAQLEQASTAWKHGKQQAARAALNRAEEKMERVDPEHGLSGLQAAHASLSAKFERAEPPVPESSTSAPPPSSSSQPPTSTTEPTEPSTSKSEQPSTPPTSTEPSTPPSTSPGKPSEPSTPPTSTEPTSESRRSGTRTTPDPESGSSSSEILPP